jgi:hypothetical protein
MTIDERVQLQVEAAGFDLEDDEGAREFQELLDKILAEEREKNQQMPQRKQERINGIMI